MQQEFNQIQTVVHSLLGKLAEREHVVVEADKQELLDALDNARVYLLTILRAAKSVVREVDKLL